MISHKNRLKRSFIEGKITKSYITFSENKPNFPHFSLENDDFTKKQTQFKPNTNPNKANFGPKSPVANPNKPKTKPKVEVVRLDCIIDDYVTLDK